MRITYVNYEFVDEVKTLTFAEGPGEAGFIMHLHRATWEDDDDVHEVVNGDGDNVLGAINEWRLTDSRLTLAFQHDAADELGFEHRIELDLEQQQAQLDLEELRGHLADILIDVAES